MDQREYSVAAVRALNYAITSTRTQAIRSLRETYNVNARTLRERAFYVRRATRNSLAAMLLASDRPLPIIHFQAKQTRKGVSVSVRKGKRAVLPGSFIARMPSGHVGVFRRMSDKFMAEHGRSRRLGKRKQNKHWQQIEQIFTASVPGMMTSTEVDAALRGVAFNYFMAEMERQGRLIVGRRNGGS